MTTLNDDVIRASIGLALTLIVVAYVLGSVLSKRDRETSAVILFNIVLGFLGIIGFLLFLISIGHGFYVGVNR